MDCHDESTKNIVPGIGTDFLRAMGANVARENSSVSAPHPEEFVGAHGPWYYYYYYYYTPVTACCVCVVYNPCSAWGRCDQLCAPTFSAGPTQSSTPATQIAGVQCSCVSGYRLLPDGHTCRVDSG